MSTCLTPEEIARLASARPPAADADARSAHLARCEQCRQAIEEWRVNEGCLAEVQEALGSGPAGSPAATRTSDATASSGGGARRAADLLDSIPGYRIIREVHRGGQGVVYEAEQLSTRRTVAVKVLLEGPFASRTSRERFQREVELVAALGHANIVTIHESGEAHGNAYFAMDYVDGLPLDRYVQGHDATPREIVTLAKTVCEAVSAAHRHGVMHRDLKPSNILVDSEGSPRVLDFGLAKTVVEQAEDSWQRPEISQAGHIMGTLRYMSPEQTRGELASVDIRTDVYSLGVILYELLTGTVPYDTRTELTEALHNIRESFPERPSQYNKRLNSEVDAMVLKAIEKEPARRYQSAGELAHDLGAWLEGSPVAAKSASSLYVIRKLARRHAYVTAVIGALVVTLVSAVVISLHYFRGAKEALAERDMADQAVQTANWERNEGVDHVLAVARREALGWFLTEWHAGRIDSARGVRDRVRPDAPEHAMMTFLLDTGQTVEQLRARLTTRTAPLADFAAGERHLKAGRLDEAVEAFESFLGAARRGFYRSLAEGRLAQLRPEAVTSATEGVSR